ncbi:MAG: elongation factor G [Clostridia bacterium]|nr:elongation factor G [Clostridia bacterium]
MKLYSADKIRNVAIAGHGSRGKTSLTEAMLYTAGASDRLGAVADGNTVSDYDAEEKRRKTSVSTAVCPLEWKDTKINLLDTPGLFDFASGVCEGVRAADAVMVVMAAGSDSVDVGAEKAVKAANARKLPKLFAITRCDAENADFFKTVAALSDEYVGVCPVVVPHIVGNKVDCYVYFTENKAYKYANGKATEVPVPSDDRIDSLKDEFMEAVASADEELMEAYFDAGELDHDQIVKGLSIGVAAGDITPVYACSGTANEGVDLLLNAIVNVVPAASSVTETAKDASGADVELATDPAGPLAAVCFKTVADPFVGKMSFFKVVSGEITPDTPAYNPRTGSSERMGKLVTARGGKQEDAAKITAGDIGVITKLSGISTGDTICSEKQPLTLAGVDYPLTSLSMAVRAAKKGEEEKVANGLRRLMEEDPAITFGMNEETKEQVVSGLGEQHIDVIVSKLKTKFGVEVTLSVPKVAYRETIRKKVEVQGRHKKQSGGHGQFGDVWIRFEPCDSDDLVFAEEVFGGSVPKNFFPAVEKGLRESVKKGVLAGYPVVGVKATLYDGSYHPVDSSEMAFKTAANLAFKNGIPQASPVILEPVGTLKAYMPDDNLGDIMGDITKRRGRVLGMGPADEPKMQLLEAEVPMAEMGDFPTVLRSVTAGRGWFTLEFARYEQAPENVAAKVIEEAKKNAEEED